MLTAAVALAAGLGSVCRYVLDHAIKRNYPGPFPHATFVVNLTGSLILGFVTGMALHHGWAHTTSLVLGAGFAGGYTTWSTLMWESVALVETKAIGMALANLGLSIATGLGMAALGLGLAQLG